MNGLKNLFTTLLILMVAACATISRDMFKPTYKGVDAKAEDIVKDFNHLAMLHGIGFSGKITLGFKDIKRGEVIGLCYRYAFYREVELDNSFWAESAQVSRVALVFHEMAHCACGRNHDYKGVEYPATEEGRNKARMDWYQSKPVPGYYEEDFCPKSLMHPTIVQPNCLEAHYQDYIDELFEGCKPY